MRSIHITKSQRSGWAVKLAVAFCSVFTILVVGELCARFLVRAWPFERAMVLPTHMTGRDATLRWRFSSADGRNSLGLKNSEIAQKPRGTTRVLFLGDSLVWSGETSSGRLYTEVIEANLNDRASFDASRLSSRPSEPTPFPPLSSRPSERGERAEGSGRGNQPLDQAPPPRSFDSLGSSGSSFAQDDMGVDQGVGPNHERPHYEVINAGVPGYTTYQELEFLRIHGLDMEPDLVILCFVVNDVYFKYLHKPTADTTLGSEPSHHLHHFDPRSFPGKLMANSYFAHLLHFAAERAGRRVLGRPRFPFQIRGDFYLAWKDHGWFHTERLLATMQRELIERGIDLTIVAFPIRDQVDATYLALDRDYVLYPQHRLSMIADLLDVPLLDLTPALIEAGGPALFTDSLHLKPSGNDVVAGVLTEYLANKAGQIFIDQAISN